MTPKFSLEKGWSLNYVVLTLVIIAVLAVLLAAWRFLTLRSRGTSVILRKLPAQGLHGWRHGTLRYNGNDLEYFKLRSLSPMANMIIDRLSVKVLNRRGLVDDEAAFMSSELHVLKISVGSDEYELALDTHGEMAFTAWVESAPDARHQHSLSPSDFVRNETRRDRK